MKARSARKQREATLAEVFAVLDPLLAIAVDRQAHRLGAASLLDPWRGMHLGAEDVRAVLAEAPHIALGDGDRAVALIAAIARRMPRLVRIADWLALTDADLAIMMLALAPEVGLRYERVYAYLQDDITRKRPGIDLIANLLCADVDERLALVSRFDPAAPLVRFGVLAWRPADDVPLLARPLALDALWRNYFLGRDELDPQLARCARIVPNGRDGIDGTFVEVHVRSAAKAVTRDAASGKGDVRLVLLGPHGAGKFALAAALAHDLGVRLLVVDVRDLASAVEVREILERARSASALLGSLLYIHGIGVLAQRDAQLLRSLAEMLATSRSWFVLSVNAPLPQMHTPAMKARHLELRLPPTSERLRIWRSVLAAEGVETDAEDVERVATRFRLSAAQISQAVAHVNGRIAGGQRRHASGIGLAAAARGLCGEDLARLAQRIKPEAGFESLIVTPDADAQLREICARVATREAVRRDWTRDCVHARNAGITALFAGPSGTGKTLAAEVIARELGYDLFRIDLSAIVSKYIGETEKNLDRVFAAAEHANAVLFFDEADALFGKRSEVKDAHDRYANIEIAYLLQKMEQFDGLAILATNLKQNLDEAFARRLTFSVNFAFPEAAERRRLWDALWPPRAPRGDDVDLAWFAQEYRLSGGNIRNTVLAAVHLAAANGQVVSRDHLQHATRREYQKLGKNIAAPAPVAHGFIEPQR
jgi:AAA+ superfamily predicted ATPase